MKFNAFSTVFANLLHCAGKLVVICLALSAHSAAAQGQYPKRPIRLVNPYAPGGVTDVTSRIVVPQLVQAWGQQIVIDNRPGAGTNIGTEIVVRAPADGYTMLATTGAIATNPSFYPNLPFKATRDLAAVVRMADAHMALALFPNLAAKTFPEFLAMARAQPGKLTLASAGTGTSTHLAIELLKTMAKVDILHVPYKFAAPALIDVVSGQVQIMWPIMSMSLPQLRAGKLRGLGVTTRERTQLAPDLPTIAESGLPGYEIIGWNGLIAPAKTPVAGGNRVNAEVNRHLKTAEIGRAHV